MTTVPKILDRLHAVAETTSASPETIRYLPNLANPGNLRTFISALGLEIEVKAAKTLNEDVDVGVIDLALAKTQLSPADKIQAKIALLGSGWKGKAF